MPVVLVLVMDAAAGESVLVMPVRLIRCVRGLAHIFVAHAGSCTYRYGD